MGTSCEICENLHHTKISRYTVAKLVSQPAWVQFQLLIKCGGVESSCFCSQYALLCVYMKKPKGGEN